MSSSGKKWWGSHGPRAGQTVRSGYGGRYMPAKQWHSVLKSKHISTDQIFQTNIIEHVKNVDFKTITFSVDFYPDSLGNISPTSALTRFPLLCISTPCYVYPIFPLLLLLCYSCLISFRMTLIYGFGFGGDIHWIKAEQKDIPRCSHQKGQQYYP